MRVGFKAAAVLPPAVMLHIVGSILSVVSFVQQFLIFSMSGLFRAPVASPLIVAVVICPHPKDLVKHDGPFCAP